MFDTKILCCLCFLFVLQTNSQVPNGNTTIFWDNSLSMLERDLEKDFSVLERIFARNGNQEIQLISFNVVSESKDYSIVNGNWSELKRDLEQMQYDGANIYKKLNGSAKHSKVYLFTDGKNVFPDDIPILPNKSLIVNSSTERDAEFLKRVALVNRSRLMDFAAIRPENIIKSGEGVTNSSGLLKGTVYMDNKPMADVKVAVKGKPDYYLTDSAGNFSLEAQSGDSLIFTSKASRSLKVIPVNNNKDIQVFLKVGSVSLDEIVLIEKKLQSQKSVNTGYGVENKDQVGYAVQSISEDEISDVNTDMATATQGKFSGVSLGQNDDMSQVRMRPSNSILGNSYGLIVVDGVPLPRSDSSSSAAINLQKASFLDPRNIESVTVLKGLAATNRFGSEGVNGVILITTKTASSNREIDGKRKDLALVKDNVYTENDLSRATTPYLNIFKDAKNIEEAYDTYLSLRSINGNDDLLYLDAFTYFSEHDKKKAMQIISNLMEIYDDDATKFRTVAMALSSIGSYTEAVGVNEKIIALHPSNAQAYLDRALAKKDSGKYQEALDELLALATGGVNPELNFLGISKTLNREIRNLIANYKGKLDLSRVESKYLNNVTYNVRLVFEWNDPKAEFELQFVNPQKRFFNWEHSNNTNGERIKDEIQNGYSSEEFEFYGDGVEGQWIVNAKYLGSLSSAEEKPFVLKCTLYQNFGSPDETVEKLLLYFSKPNEKVNIKNLFVN